MAVDPLTGIDLQSLRAETELRRDKALIDPETGLSLFELREEKSRREDQIDPETGLSVAQIKKEQERRVGVEQQREFDLNVSTQLQKIQDVQGKNVIDTPLMRSLDDLIKQPSDATATPGGTELREDFAKAPLARSHEGRRQMSIDVLELNDQAVRAQNKHQLEQGKFPSGKDTPLKQVQNFFDEAGFKVKSQAESGDNVALWIKDALDNQGVKAIRFVPEMVATMFSNDIVQTAIDFPQFFVDIFGKNALRLIGLDAGNFLDIGSGDFLDVGKLQLESSGEGALPRSLGDEMFEGGLFDLMLAFTAVKGGIKPGESLKGAPVRDALKTQVDIATGKKTKKTPRPTNIFKERVSPERQRRINEFLKLKESTGLFEPLPAPAKGAKQAPVSRFNAEARAKVEENRAKAQKAIESEKVVAEEPKPTPEPTVPAATPKKAISQPIVETPKPTKKVGKLREQELLDAEIRTQPTEVSSDPTKTTALNKASIERMVKEQELNANLSQAERITLKGQLEKGMAEKADTRALDVAQEVLASRETILVSTVDHVGMVIKADKIQSAKDAATRAHAEALEKGDVQAQQLAARDIEVATQQLITLVEASQKAGTGISGAFTIRRLKIIRDTYDIASVVAREQIMRGRELTSGERKTTQAIVEGLETQIKLLDKKNAEWQAENIKIREQLAEGLTRNEVTKRRARKVKQTDKDANLAERNLAFKALEKEGVFTLNSGFNPEVLFQIGRIAKTYVKDGLKSLPAIQKQIQKDFPQLRAEDIVDGILAKDPKTQGRAKSDHALVWSKLQKQSRLTKKLKEGIDKLTFRKPSIETDPLIVSLKKQLEIVKKRDAARKAELKKRETLKGKIRDVDAGKKPAPKKAPKESPEITRLKEQLAERRRVKTLERKIADERAGKRNVKALKKEFTSTVSDLMKTLREIKEINRATRNDRARVERTETRVNDLIDMLDNKWRAVTEKKRPRLSSAKEKGLRELEKDLNRELKLEDEMGELLEEARTGEYRIRRPKLQRPTRTRPESLENLEVKVKRLRKLIDRHIEDALPSTVVDFALEASQALRTFAATGEMSAIGRQGLILTTNQLIKNPKLLGLNFLDTLRATFSQMSHEAIAHRISELPQFYKLDRAGLELSEVGAKLTRKEETVGGAFIDLLLKEEIAFRVAGVPLSPVRALGQFFKGADRNMTTFLNLMRVESMNWFLEKYPKSTIAEQKAWAHWININSGKGAFSVGKGVAAGLGLAFFAPRFAVSRIQTLLAPLQFKTTPPRVLKEIYREMVTTFAFYSAAMTWMAVNGWEVGLDPRSPDFGKAVKDDMHIDFGAGFIQPARLLASAILGLSDSMGYTGKHLSASQKKFGTENFFRFAEYKVSPATNLLLNVGIGGQNIFGRKVDRLDALYEALAPLAYRDIAEAWQSGGFEAAGTVAPLVFIGVGANVYEKRGRKGKTKF